MPRNITVYFSDGSAHQYNNAPDVLTPDDIEQRAKKDYPNKKMSKIDGGQKVSSLSQDNQGAKNKIYKNYTEEDITQGVDKSKQDSLISNLLDPEAAKFRRLEVWEEPNEKNPGDTVLMLIGEINAKNSFGAYGGFRQFYAIGIEFPGKPNFIMISIASNDRWDATYTMIEKYKSKGKLIWSGR